MNPEERYLSAIEDAQALLRQLAQGPRKTATLSPEVAEVLAALTAPENGATPPPSAAPRPVATPVSGNPSLSELAEIVRGCQQCSLHETRTQTVFGVGNEKADLVFVGDAPGALEDAQGEPFVGDAGQLLTDIITKGMKMRREDVYICNALKCHPPNDRHPDPAEMSCCEPYLIQQLAQIRPKVICALGDVAAQSLLHTEENVGQLRGTWHTYQGIPLRVTYHPSDLLRTPADKGKTWADIQEVMKVLSGEVTPQV